MATVPVNSLTTRLPLEPGSLGIKDEVIEVGL